ncbi:MAG: biopolymer transporter ExbD [Thermoguttaceae bacterium]|nr:biopolymer transporter ExbD [Thermoguttaceae bacterium]
MKIPSSRGSAVGFNMTPMIDIVFQLIIFFLVSSHLAQSQMQYVFDLPEAKTGQEQLETTKATKIVINLLPPEEGGTEYTILLAGEPVDIPTLKKKLTYERSKKQQMEIHIRASQKTPYKIVEPILTACAQSGVWDVRFAVYEK